MRLPLLGIIGFAIVTLGFPSQPMAQAAKKAALCQCAKELFGIEIKNGRCTWNNRQADPISVCAAKK